MKTRPYRPSNGTEGAIFDDAWCARCEHDAAWRRDESAVPCDILSRSLAYGINDPGYPIEWIEDDGPYDQDTNPRCTAFVETGTEESTYQPDPRQGELDL